MRIYQSVLFEEGYGISAGKGFTALIDFISKK